MKVCFILSEDRRLDLFLCPFLLTAVWVFTACTVFSQGTVQSIVLPGGPIPGRCEGDYRSIHANYIYTHAKKKAREKREIKLLSTKVCSDHIFPMLKRIFPNTAPCSTCSSFIYYLLLISLLGSRTVSSRRSVAELDRLSFPPLATVPPIPNVEDRCVMCQQRPLLDSYDPPGIPLKANLLSFSNMNHCPSNRCHKWTILVHLLAFWVGFLQAVQAKKGASWTSVARLQLLDLRPRGKSFEPRMRGGRNHAVFSPCFANCLF